MLLEEVISVCCRSLWSTIANSFFIGKKDPTLFLLHGNNTNTNAIAMVHRYDSGVDIAIGGRGPVASVWFVSAAVAYLY